MNRNRFPTLPSSTADWRSMARTVRLVLSIPAFAAIALCAAFFGLSLFVVSLNLEVVELALTGTLPTSVRLRTLASLYPVVGTGVGSLEGALLLCVAALFGIDAALVTYHLSEPAASASSDGGSALAPILGAFAAVWAACGSVLLAGVLSPFGGSGAVLVLPLDGLEILVLALVAVLLSIHWVAEGLRGGVVAGRPVDPSDG